MNPKPTLFLLALFLGFGACGESEDPLPEDLFEDGWDQATPQQRTKALETEVTQGLERIDADPAAASTRALDELTAMMSALRAELGADAAARARYIELERRLETVTGD